MSLMNSFRTKKIILITVFLLLLIVVSGSPRIYRVKSFSYASDYSAFNSWAKFSGFENTVPCKAESAWKAVELAKNEVTVKYNRINVSFDEIEKIWRISFYMADYVCGDQQVYINEDGITLMLVWGI